MNVFSLKQQPKNLLVRFTVLGMDIKHCLNRIVMPLVDFNRQRIALRFATSLGMSHIPRFDKKIFSLSTRFGSADNFLISIHSPFKVDFIEKSYSRISDVLEKLAYFAIRGHSETNDWSELKLKKRTKSIGQSIKDESNALIQKLKNTVTFNNFMHSGLISLLLIFFQKSQFIHCVKPNRDMIVQKFDECMVLKQLRSTSTLAYTDFVRFGFPLRISVAKMQSLYAPHYHICTSARKFHMKLLLAIGLRIGQFKLGQNFIFFRSDQHEKMQQLLLVSPCILALKRYKARTRWLILLMLLMKFTRKGTADILSNVYILFLFNQLCLLFRNF